MWVEMNSTCSADPGRFSGRFQIVDQADPRPDPPHGSILPAFRRRCHGVIARGMSRPRLTTAREQADGLVSRQRGAEGAACLAPSKSCGSLLVSASRPLAARSPISATSAKEYVGRRQVGGRGDLYVDLVALWRSSGTGKQPGRHGHRHHARRSSGRSGGLARIHPAPPPSRSWPSPTASARSAWLMPAGSTASKWSRWPWSRWRCGPWHGPSPPMGNEPASRSSPPPPRSCGRRGSGRVTIIAVAALLGWRLFPGALAVRGTRARIPVGRRVGVCTAHAVRGPARGVARRSRAHGLAVPRRLRQLLPRGVARLRGGHVVLPSSSPKSFPRAGSPTRSSSRGMVRPRPCPVRSSPSPPTSARSGPASPRSRGSHHRPRGHLPAVLPLDRGNARPSGTPFAREAGFQGALARNQRGGGRPPPRRPLPARVDERDPRSARSSRLALAAFGLLAFAKAPAWLVVVLTAAGGALLALITR